MVLAKHGGLKTNKVDDADFIFSSKAAAKDTIRYKGVFIYFFSFCVLVHKDVICVF